jgi:hypothetical protein
MKNIDSTYIALGATWLVVGMGLGLVMGAKHDFQFLPIHAHINLVGFACHSLFGLVYKQWPAMAGSKLAPLQFWIFVLATPVMLIGLYFTLTGGVELPTILGSTAVAIGAALFAIMVWRMRLAA